MHTKNKEIQHHQTMTFATSVRRSYNLWFRATNQNTIKRSIFGSALKRLEARAETNPHDATIQANLLKKLNELNMYDEVIRRCESDRYARNLQTDLQLSIAKLGKAGEDLIMQEQSNRFESSSIRRTDSAAAGTMNRSTALDDKTVSPELTEKALISLLNNQHAMNEVMKNLIFERVASENAAAQPKLRWMLLRAAVTFVTIYIFYKLFFSNGSPVNGGTHSLLSGLTPAFTPIVHTGKTFDDVKGIDECKEEVMEIVQFLKNPEEFARLGGKLPRGVLLSGPPGTGKTLIAKAIAGEAGVPFFYASGAEFDGMLVGLGAKRIISLFEAAKKYAPAIIFIDEIDALGGKRGIASENYHRQTINQFLSELDGFNTQEGIIVIGATNFPEVLDPALLRPGRFDKKIHIPLPNLHGRLEILKLYLKNVPVAKDIDIERIASHSVGFSGAELENLVNTASIRASRLKHETVTNADLDFAFDRIAMGVERRNLMDQKDRYVTAVHETGHALMTVLNDKEKELHKLTILPRGPALGFTSSLQRKETVSMTKAEMQSRITVLLGGIVAEEIIFGKDNVTSGASNDLEVATALAREMVEHYGMSNLGLLTFKRKDVDACSPETKREIDLEVRRIIDECYQKTKESLLNSEKDLRKIADVLMEYETLTGSEVQTLLNGGKLGRKPTEDIQFNP